MAGRAAASGATQFGLLLRRAWREVARSRGALAIKVVQQLMIAVIYGGAAWASTRRVYTRSLTASSRLPGGIYSLGDSQSSIQDRFGLLSLIAIGAGNLAIASTIRALPTPREGAPHPAESRRDHPGPCRV